MCQKQKGVFVDKKQILYKLEPTIIKETKPAKKKGSRNSVARKGSDSTKKKKKKKDKGGWKAPSWADSVLDDDTGFLDDRRAHRGKQVDRKSLYQKAGYLPHAKWRKKKYTPEQWAEAQQDINDETARIEAERQRIQWEQDELARKQLEMEEAERLKKLEEERQKKQAQIAAEKERLRLQEEEMARKAREEEEERMRRLQEEERKRRAMLEEQEELERERRRLADLQKEAEAKRQKELEEQMKRIQAEKDALAKEEEERR